MHPFACRKTILTQLLCTVFPLSGVACNGGPSTQQTLIAAADKIRSASGWQPFYFIIIF